MQQWVALLYSTVIGPDRRVRASDLTGVADRIGLAQPRVVLSSGNLIFSAIGREQNLRQAIKGEVAALYGRDVPVLVRSKGDWQKLVAAYPFTRECARDPKDVAVRIMSTQPDDGVVARIAAKKQPGDLLEVGDRVIWAYAPGGAAGSALFRAVNATWAGVGTSRNSSAVQKILTGFNR